MSGWPAGALGFGALLSAATLPLALRAAPRRLRRPNYAGRLVAATLSVPLLTGALGAAGLILGWVGAYNASIGVLLTAAMVVALAGLLDDLAAAGPRGLAGHLTSLARGRPTTGILKLVAAIGAAAWVAFTAGGGALRIALGTILIATSTNVGNALDVVPGRALKWGGLALVAVMPVVWARPIGIVVAATVGAVIVVLPADVLERGMLGDAGSNGLGFLVGAGLVAALPTWGLVVGVGLLLALQAAAETVTISRIVEAVPPLAWLDGLGRRAGSGAGGPDR